MKKVNLYCLLISVLCLIFIWGCGQGTELENSNDSLEVEINLAKSLSVNKQDLKLIGFKIYYADEKGVVKTDDVINLDEVDVAVIGRKRSEYVRGTGTNIIEGDKLFLATPLLTNRNILNRGYVGDKKCKL